MGSTYSCLISNTARYLTIICESYESHEYETNIYWQTLHKKWNFPLKVSSVNVNKSAGNSGFSYIYKRNLYWNTSFFLQWKFWSSTAEKKISRKVSEKASCMCFIKKFRIIQSKTVMEPVCSKVVVCEIPNFSQGCLLNPINKSQCSYHVETTQLICCVNQLNGFQIMETAPLDMLSSVLTYQSSCFRQFDWTQGTCLVTTHSLSKKIL